MKMHLLKKKLGSRILFYCIAASLITCSSFNVADMKQDCILVAHASTNVENMYPVDSTYAFIKDVEGFSPQCFWDVAQWTIGYGNKCPHEHSSNGTRGQYGGHYITESEARELFDEKLSKYVNQLKSDCRGLSMNQNQFDALLSATYNHGNVASCPLKYYLTGQYSESEAREKYYVWCINKGTADEAGLRNRRKKEANLFFAEVLIVDPNWQVPATVTPNITSGSIPVYDISGNQESNRYIDYNDECYIEEVYTNGLVHVKYPSTAEPSGYRWAYAKLDEFTLQKKDKPAVDTSWNVPVTVTPKIESGSIPVYDMFGNAESNRYIDYNDECYIDEVYTNGLVHVKYPSVAEASGYRWAYAKLDDFPLSKKGNKPDVDTDWEVPATLTPNITSGSIPVCDIQGNTEANRYIDYNDECYIDEVYTNGLVHVKYPSIAEESGYRWAYAKLEYFSLKKKDDLLTHVTNYGDDFSAIILNADSSSKPWKPIMRDGDNVVLGTESSTNYDCTLWHFIRHSDDGTYTIYSYKDGKALDVDGSGETYDNGVNVQVWESNGTINQKWYLIKLSDGTFRLRPKCADKVMDVNGAYAEDGTNLQIWESNHTSAQCFAVYPMNGERDVLNYTIKAEKTSIAIGKTDKITISGDIPYVYNYKFHIVDQSGKETTKDNGCNPVYQFSAAAPGEYTVFAEVTNPLYSQVGSLTEKSIKITVDCEHSYTEKIVPPTCTTKGYTLHTCSICGESYKDHETEMIAHDYQGKITKEPTYDEEGVRTFTCSVCGDKYTEAIPKLQKDISEDTSEPDTGIETTPTETSTTEPATPKRTPGDVNDDGQVNLKDVVLLSRYIAGGMGVSINESAADVNGDNLINLKDVVLIRRYIVGGWNVTLH